MNYRLLLPVRIFFALTLACAITLTCSSVPPSAAQADPAAELLARINAARVAHGLAPYALNDKLTAAAQAHSKDMAAAGKVDRAGSDGSTPKSRILAAGYGQWTIGPVVDEAIYGGTGGALGAFDWWMSTDADKNRILSARFREVGIGAATAPNGWVYWTLDLGAQPNALPAFVNNGATSVDAVMVTLTLTTENAVPAGEGTNTMGQPVQIRVASDDSFTGADWQPWAAQIPFQLLPQAQQRVYVVYRDAQGRTALYWINVTLTRVPPTATTIPSPSPSPTLPPSITPQPTATTLPSATPQPTAAAPATSKPTETTAPIGAPVSTLTGGVSATLTLAAPGARPSVSPSPSSTAIGAAPSATPRALPRPRTTPTTVVAGPYGSAPGGLATAVCALQAAACVLAALIIARRSLNRLPPAPAPLAADSPSASQDAHIEEQNSTGA